MKSRLKHQPIFEALYQFNEEQEEQEVWESVLPNEDGSKTQFVIGPCTSYFRPECGRKLIGYSLLIGAFGTFGMKGREDGNENV